MTAEHKILLVDDDKEDQQMVLEYFTDEKAAHLLLFRKNGKEALEYLDTETETALPDLIVLDVNMPILNGTQTLILLKQSKRYKDIPVIIFSTSENENEKRKCLNYGAVDFVVKPASYEEGLATCRRFIAFTNK